MTKVNLQNARFDEVGETMIETYFDTCIGLFW